ncbi:MAG TPA: AAA family ATPase, partial [Candidatus Hodarchaeales archaeon]|nr:AAA family ATPase [Candidatus Hodarchaeales archaeon]
MHRSWKNSWIKYARGWTQLVQLTKIKLTDWKHLKGTIEILFVPGLNVIRAPNFAGKTSILEALKFCLSGDLPDYKE